MRFLSCSDWLAKYAQVFLRAIAVMLKLKYVRHCNLHSAIFSGHAAVTVFNQLKVPFPMVRFGKLD